MQVIFNGTKHEYRDENGTVYPSVTQILQASGKANYDFIGDERREIYFQRGTAVHWMLELSDQGALNYRKLSKDMRGYRKAWNTWKQRSGFVVTRIEWRFISPRLGYAGTADRMGYFKSMPTIPVVVDLKTGTAIPEWVKWQLSAYVMGAIERSKWQYARRIAFQPYPTGLYSVKEYTPQSYHTDSADFLNYVRRYK